MMQQLHLAHQLLPHAFSGPMPNSFHGAAPIAAPNTNIAEVLLINYTNKCKKNIAYEG